MNTDHPFYECNLGITSPDNRLILSLKEIFTFQNDQLENIKKLASKIREKLENLHLFIQQANQIICPRCKDVCCINKHGRYAYEDLIYLFALGQEPPPIIQGRHDTDPCQYLLENGCSIERWRRPSGCNWYFCDPLLDYMELQSGYKEFDETLREVAELWLEMVETFERISG